MKIVNFSYVVLLMVLICSCGKEGLSDQEIPEQSRNSKLNVSVELCTENGCEALEGKLINIYEYEDEATGSQSGLKSATTDIMGVAHLGSVELESVYVTVRHDGILDISRVSLPRNSLSHHFVSFVKE